MVSSLSDFAYGFGLTVVFSIEVVPLWFLLRKPCGRAVYGAGVETDPDNIMQG